MYQQKLLEIVLWKLLFCVGSIIYLYLKLILAYFILLETENVICWPKYTENLSQQCATEKWQITITMF